MKIKDLTGWPRRPVCLRSGRLTGIGLDQSRPEMLLLSIEADGETSFDVLRLDSGLQRNVFAILSDHTGERVSEVGELRLNARRTRRAEDLWQRVLRAARKCYGFLPLLPAGPYRKVPL